MSKMFPPRLKADLVHPVYRVQSAPSLKPKMSAERLELSTNGLKGQCSAIELRAHFA